MHVFNKIFRLLSSLKIAVLIILTLASALAAATFIESLYDTKTAKYWVYSANWFFGVLAALGLNIFCVALSRYPWKKKHIPFLLAHAGILILLAGSWITERGGIDGSLRVSEKDTTSVVDLEEYSLYITEKDKVLAVPIPWIPSEVKFKPFSLDSRVSYDLTVDQYLTHADPEVSFVPATFTPESSAPAIQIRITGGPMKISQELWLWEGDSAWKAIQAGPAHFSIGVLEERDLHPRPGQPTLAFQAEKDGSLSYRAISSAGKHVQGKILKSQIRGKTILPQWKGDVAIDVVEWIPQAMPYTVYKPARIQHGAQAPSSAVHVVTPGSSGEVGVWLGLGDRASFHAGDREIGVGYFGKRVVLPFSLRLDRFTVEHDPGTLSAASYASNVTVEQGAGPQEVQISMNEPLQAGRYTVYQASYEEGYPRPTTSIFAVNYDPGRVWKYLGSLLIVCGSILLFAAKYRRKQVRSAVSFASELELTMKPEFLKR